MGKLLPNLGFAIFYLLIFPSENLVNSLPLNDDKLHEDLIDLMLSGDNDLKTIVHTDGIEFITPLQAMEQRVAILDAMTLPNIGPIQDFENHEIINHDISHISNTKNAEKMKAKQQQPQYRKYQNLAKIEWLQHRDQDLQENFQDIQKYDSALARSNSHRVNKFYQIFYRHAPPKVSSGPHGERWLEFL